MSGWCRTCVCYKTLHYMVNNGERVENYSIEKLPLDIRSHNEIMQQVKKGSSNYDLGCSKYKILFTQFKNNCSGHQERD